MMKLKIFLLLSLGLSLALIMLAGCGANGPDALLEPLTGEWSCEETSLENTEVYTGYLALRVEKDGEFSMYDAEAGNPGISGKMQAVSDGRLRLKCDEADFDPPANWEGMKSTQEIGYEIVSDQEIRLIYGQKEEASTLVFHRD